jgi:hypothetical protein
VSHSFRNVRSLERVQPFEASEKTRPQRFGPPRPQMVAAGPVAPRVYRPLELEHMSKCWLSGKRALLAAIASSFAVTAFGGCSDRARLATAPTELTASGGGIPSLNLAIPNTKFGDAVSSGFSRVPVYSNSDLGKPAHPGDSYYNGRYMGERWQCVEFVRRFTYVEYGVLLPQTPSAAAWWNADLSHLGLRRVADGSNELPQVGDVLIWWGGSSNDGHTGIAQMVGSSSITVAQQNTVQPNQQFVVYSTQLAGTKTYRIKAMGGYITKGWFTRRARPILVPAIGGIAPLNPQASVTAKSVAIVTSGIINPTDVTVLLFDPSKRQAASFSVSGATLSVTPGGMVFSAKLPIAGKWAVQLRTGGLTSQKYSFSVKK